MAIRMTGMASGLDTETMVKELMTAKRTKQTKIENSKTKLEWTQDKWKSLNTKIYKLYTDSVAKMRLQGSYKTKEATTSNTSVATATATASAATGSHTLEVTQLASSQYVTGSKVEDMTSSTKLTDKGIVAGTVITLTSGTGSTMVTKDLTVDADTTVSSLVEAAQGIGLNATFDATQKRFFISSSDSGLSNQFSISSSAGILNKIGLTDITSTTTAENALADGVAYVLAANAKIKLDGAELTETKNNFTAAGINFTLLNKTTTGQNISLNITNNTQAAYDSVKGFVKEYNTLLDEMNDIYYADSARGYDPLTDDEKETMTDDQIEKWETKIKDSLLRRDSSLGNLISAMKTALTTSVKVDGKDVTLSSYGIMTSTDYTEKGLLHIYGDTTDSTYSTKTNKLMEALTSDPDKVAEALSGIAKNLYETMTEKMKSSSLNSALTFYNDKQMTKQVTAYKKEITEWEDRLQTMETNYYKQFTALEKAMQSLNSKSSSLTSLLGTSS